LRRRNFANFVILVCLKRKIAKNVKFVNIATLERKLVALRKIVKFGTDAKIVKFVAEFNPGHKCININKGHFISQITTLQIGDLDEATLRIDESLSPKLLPYRKVPLALQDAVKEELDRFGDKGVLVPVTKPTEWVSQMAVVTQPMVNCACVLP